MHNLHTFENDCLIKGKDFSTPLATNPTVDKILYQIDLPNSEAHTARSHPCGAVMKILLSLYPSSWLAVFGRTREPVL